MFQSTVSALFAASILSVNTLISPIDTRDLVIAESSLSLQTRQPDRYVNEVFKENILLSLAYLDGRVTKADQINWDEIKRSAKTEFRLKPGQVFAFHDTSLPQYEGKVVKTTNAHFNATEGFKQFNGLYGNGVCHLASLMYLTAKAADLEAYAPTNHNFAEIPQIPREYGVSIYNQTGAISSSAAQNLYITNNKARDILLRLDYNEENLKLTILEAR